MKEMIVIILYKNSNITKYEQQEHPIYNCYPYLNKIDHMVICTLNSYAIKIIIKSLEQYYSLVLMTSNNPRCPNGILSKFVCVTQKCNASPYLCDSNRLCACYNAHRYCKTMEWASVLSLLNNYQQSLAEPMKLFMERIRKIYDNIKTKINTEVKIFQDYVQEQLYGPEYSKIMHYLKKQDFNSITCQSLGTIISVMTERVFSKNSNQEGRTSMQKFTLNQMKSLDKSIANLLLIVENLYKDKYRIIQRQVRELNKNKRSNSSINVSNSQISASTIYSSHYNATKNTSSLQKFNEVPMTQSLVLKRSQSIQKNYNPERTFSTNFYNTGSKQQFKKTDFTSTKDTAFFNPQNPIKQDLSYPKSINSKVVFNASILNHLIMAKVKQYKLIYRASENDYSISQFYRKMTNYTFYNQKNKTNPIQDSKSMTLLLARTQFGKIVGGFTRLAWSRQNNTQQDDQDNKKSSNYKQDIRGTSMIFSIDLNERYQLLQPQYAIYCGSKSIGFGKNDIRIVNHSEKHSKNYIGFPSSYNNGLYLPIKKSSLTLSGSHDSVHFKINEWQVFEVILTGQKQRENKSSSYIQLTKQKLMKKLKQK